MSEARNGKRRSPGMKDTKADYEARTPELSPLRVLNSDHEPMMIQQKQQQQQQQQQQENPPKESSCGSGGGGSSNDASTTMSLKDLGLMLPVLEETDSATTFRTPPTDIPRDNHFRLPPLRFSPSPAYTRFCQETLPSMREFNTTNTGADPRSVIPNNNNNNNNNNNTDETTDFSPVPFSSPQQQQREHGDNNESRISMPNSLCVPDFGVEEGEEEMEVQEQVDQGSSNNRSSSSSSDKKGSFLHSMRLFPKRRKRDK